MPDRISLNVSFENKSIFELHAFYPEVAQICHTRKYCFEY